MPNNTFYVHLYDKQPVTILSNITLTLSNTQTADTNTNTVGYSYPYITNQQYYTAFLHNPVSSNKILRIKELNYKSTGGATASGFPRLIIARASSFASSSVEPYQKLDTNSADLPQNVGISFSPGVNYTNNGSIRIIPPLNIGSMTFPGMQRTTYGEGNLNSLNIYSGQPTQTVLQDFTLAAGQNLIFAWNGDTIGNFNMQISILFSSGSNTYYTDVYTPGASIPARYDAANRTSYYPAAFINGSNTSIKIHKIDINLPYRDYGVNQPGFGSIATNVSRYIIIDHVGKNRLPDLTNNLINSDVLPIISLDTTTSLPNNIKCYRSSVSVPSDLQNDITAVNGFARYVGIRGRFFKPAVGNVGISLQNPNSIGLALLDDYSESTKQDLKFNKSGQEIIIRPGEGLGFFTIPIVNQQDMTDTRSTGNILFTVEDIPSDNAVVETGFGY